MRSADYGVIADVPRPGHADYTAFVKYGSERDVCGGGRFSGRLTAPMCIAGGIVLQILESMGMTVTARILSVGNTAQYTAAMICFRPHVSVFVKEERVIVLAAGNPRRSETAAELDPLDGGYSENDSRNAAFKPLEHRAAESCGDTLRRAFDDAPERVSGGFCVFDRLLHRLLDAPA